MSEPTALVTGATAGIGLHTAHGLARQGMTVLITGRTTERGLTAAEQIRRQAGHDRIHFLSADHSTVAGNRALAAAVADRFARLDVLANNVAGSPHAQRTLTAEGFEATLATQFLGPAGLTNDLLPLLRSSAPARIVNVVSSAHAMWRRDPFDDLDAAGGYVGIQVYAHAKLLNLLWTLALARRLIGSGVIVNATNPGMAWTPGTQALTQDFMPAWRAWWPLFRLIQRRGSAERAARSCIWLASSPEAGQLSGAYVESNGKVTDPAPAARDPAHQDRAFDLAAELIARVRA